MPNEITIKTLDGCDTVFSIEDEMMTVETFKKEVEERLKISANLQRLIFRGRVLQDSQTLKELGVLGKVVHLVQRAPPSNRENQPESNADDFVGSEGTGYEGYTFDGINMQQTLQDITTGILNSVSELTNSNLNGHFGNEPATPRTLTAMHERSFNRMHRHASRLIRRIMHTSASSSTDTDGISPLGEANAEDLFTDHSSESKSNEADNATCSTDEPVSSASKFSFGNLADMIARYRSLWHQAEPYFEQCEAMLLSEDKIQSELVANASFKDDDAVVDESKIADDSIQSNVPSTSKSGIGKEDYSQQVSYTWQKRFFNQISRLLHLQAHMLHLVSDFSVVTVREQSASQSEANNVDSEEVGSESTTPTNMDVDLTSPPKVNIFRPAHHPQRVLSVMENDHHRNHHHRAMRARVSIGTPDVTIVTASTDGTAASGRLNVTDIGGSRLARPPTVLESFTPMHRSHSTSNINRTPNTVGVSAPTTIVTAAGGLTAHIGSTPNLASAFSDRAAAIVHCVDIPIISMNMRSMPGASHLLSSAASSLLPPTGSQPFRFVTMTGATTPTSILSSSTTATTRQYTVDTSAPSTTTTTTTSSHTTQSTSASSGHSTATISASIDPFLRCNSRHFSSDLGQGLTNRILGGSTSNFISGPFLISPNLDNSRRGGGQRSTTTAESTNASGVTTNSVRTEASSQPYSTAFSGFTTSPAFTQSSTPNVGSFTLPGFDLSSFVSAAAAAVSAAASRADFGSATNLPFGSDMFIFNTSPVNVTQSSTGGSTTTTTTTASRRSNAFEKPKPAWSEPETDVSSIAIEPNLMHLFQVFSVFVASLIRIVRSRISSSSSSALPNFEARSILTQSRLIPVGFLTGVLQDMCNQLTTVGDVSHFESSVLDPMRQHMQHGLHYAKSAWTRDPADQSTSSRPLAERSHLDDLIEAIVGLIFDCKLSDADDVDYSLECGLEAVDVRASFVVLVRYIVSNQLELWQASPTNTGFGTTLLMTLKLACIDLLCLTDVLVQQSGIRANGVASSGPSSSPSNYYDVYGFELDFSMLLEDLKTFFKQCEDDAKYSLFCRLFITGLTDCINFYGQMSESSLKSSINNQKLNYVIKRSPKSRAVEKPVSSSVVTNQLDDDMLPFVDAKSNFSSENDLSSADRSPRPMTSKISNLPDWDPKPGQIPDDWSTLLDRNANNEFDNQTTANHSPTNVEGWHAVLDPSWVHIVANDVNMMAANDDLGPLSVRFSDGYIAGMPPKRRKVMQEHSRSTFQSPDALFVECLSDAVKSTTDSLDSTSPTNHMPKANNELVVALRDMVSTRIASRLADDSDFDPIKFPAANRIFKKKTNNSKLD